MHSRLKAEMAERGYSLQKMANRSGLSVNHISRLCKLKLNFEPKWTSLFAVCEPLKLKIVDVFTVKKIRPKKRANKKENAL